MCLHLVVGVSLTTVTSAALGKFSVSLPVFLLYLWEINLPEILEFPDWIELEGALKGPPVPPPAVGGCVLHWRVQVSSEHWMCPLDKIAPFTFFLVFPHKTHLCNWEETLCCHI